MSIEQESPVTNADALGAMARIQADLQILGGVDARSLTGTDAMDLAAQASAACARLTGVRLAALVQVESTGAWALDGSRSMAWALARNEDAKVSTIRAEITLAQRLDSELPLTGAALRDGEVSADKARLLARLAPTSAERRAALRDDTTGERFLLAKAGELDAWQLTKAVKYWGYRADPDADDRNYKETAHRRELEVADTLDGTQITGFVSPEIGEVVRAALDAINGTPDKTDPRTRGQRNADALGTLARFFLDSGEVKAKAGIRPHLNVTVSYETLLAKAGEVGLNPAVFTESGMPVPKVVLDRLKCDSELSRVMFDHEGIVLDAGRTKRIVSEDQRRAVIARDGECQRPGCHAPPGICEVHHRVWWERGGNTSVEDSVLLCFRCHDWVHREDITITRVGDHWEFTKPNGQVIH
jgi:Domain of unknown function (DUF222)/HNH endonuclease